MVNKKFAREPLLYIDQNVGSAPQAPMQHNYVTPKTKVSTSEEPQAKPKTRPRTLKRNFLSNEKVRHHVTEDHLNSGDEKETKVEKKFNDMTVLEKISYLIERPDHAPQIRSEIRTKDDVFQGIVTASDETTVSIRVGRRVSSTEIQLSEIENISLLGF